MTIKQNTLHSIINNNKSDSVLYAQWLLEATGIKDNKIETLKQIFNTKKS